MIDATPLGSHQLLLSTNCSPFLLSLPQLIGTAAQKAESEQCHQRFGAVCVQHVARLNTSSLAGHREGSQLTRLLPSPAAPLMADRCRDAGADAGAVPPKELRRVGVPVPSPSVAAQLYQMLVSL